MTIPAFNPKGANVTPTLGAAVQGCTDLHSLGGATNQAATLLAAARSDACFVVTQAFWSYTATAAGGKLTISDGTTTWEQLLPSGVQNGGQFTFDPRKAFAKNATVTATLAAVAAVTGELDLTGYYQT